EVDVDLARAPPAFLGTLAPERPLHRLCASQKCTRGKARLNGDARVDEGRLVLYAPRQGAIIRRAGEQAHFLAVAERSHRPIDRVTQVAEIAAKRDECFSHGPDGRGSWRLPRRQT